MSKPLVAIVGRPNVGKSTFFNRIVGKRISITSEEQGTTRDRIYEDAEWCGNFFTLVDTGGIDRASDDKFQKDIFAQAKVAMDTADVILFMVDGQSGVTENDSEIAGLLRRSKTPILLVVNKLDNFDLMATYEFMALGLGDPVPLSCEQSKGIGDALDRLVELFPKKSNEEQESDGLKIAIVGRPNVGKSSLVNKILGENRVVVSSVEGTTRDAVLVPFKHNKKDYFLIDTAGMRRKRGYENFSIESFSVLRTLDSIKRADVVVIMIDATEEISEQDVRIAGYVHEEGKPSLILVNKWDVHTGDKKAFENKLKESLAFMDYFKVDYISALTGSRVGQIIPQIEAVYANASKRITTGVVNEVLANALLSNEPPTHKGRRLKIYYMTQVSTCPPEFVLFVNDGVLMHFSYLRYIENKVRAAIDFSGTPIKFTIKNRGEE